MIDDLREERDSLKIKLEELSDQLKLKGEISKYLCLKNL